MTATTRPRTTKQRACTIDNCTRHSNKRPLDVPCGWGALVFLRTDPDYCSGLLILEVVDDDGTWRVCLWHYPHPGPPAAAPLSTEDLKRLREHVADALDAGGDHLTLRLPSWPDRELTAPAEEWRWLLDGIDEALTHIEAPA